MKLAALKQNGFFYVSWRLSHPADRLFSIKAGKNEDNKTEEYVTGTVPATHKKAYRFKTCRPYHYA